MKIVVLDDDYPSNDNLYGDVFVHVRVKEYKRVFDNVLVIASLYRNPGEDFEFDTVKVKRAGSIFKTAELLKEFEPDIILVHFYLRPLAELLIGFPGKVLVWVHGYEALGWYRRLFNLKINRGLISHIRSNMLQLHSLRKLIIQSNSDGNISFVFVSEWMKKMTEQDTLIRVINFKVIPNPINIHLFNFIPKDNEQRKRILVLRPFHSRKYAADVIALSIEKLIKYDWFHELNFTIVGGGLKSSKLYQLVKNLENVKAEDRFLTQTEIKDLHADHGIFLCPTRQDAQGVSMCEAMASGLVPISTNNTAIPEFVKDKFSGMLTNNKPVEIIKIIEQLFFDPGLFQYLSKNAAESIVKKAGIEKVIINEVRLIESTS